MASRGDVLHVKRRLGFAARGTKERFVVVQDDALNRILPTTLAIPLDQVVALHERSPLAVPVSATESGGTAPYMAVVTHVSVIPWDRFELHVAGHLLPATLARVDAALRVVLALP